MGILEKITFTVIALMFLFILSNTLIMPQFNVSYNPRSCTATAWVDNSTISNCDYDTGVNSSPTGCASNIAFCCQSCTDWEYRSTARGLLLLVLLMGLVAFALYFIPKAFGGR